MERAARLDDGPPVDDEGMLNQSPLKRTLGCPRKLATG